MCYVPRNLSQVYFAYKEFTIYIQIWRHCSIILCHINVTQILPVSCFRITMMGVSFLVSCAVINSFADPVIQVRMVSDMSEAESTTEEESWWEKSYFDSDSEVKLKHLKH